MECEKDCDGNGTHMSARHTARNPHCTSYTKGPSKGDAQSDAGTLQRVLAVDSCSDDNEHKTGQKLGQFFSVCVAEQRPLVQDACGRRRTGLHRLSGRHALLVVGVAIRSV